LLTSLRFTHESLTRTIVSLAGLGLTGAFAIKGRGNKDIMNTAVERMSKG